MDQYHGQGGSYLLDPETGERILLERTEPSVPEVAPEPVSPFQHERQRARNERGRFRGDDPSTPEIDEAWQ